METTWSSTKSKSAVGPSVLLTTTHFSICLAAIADCTYVGLATVSFKDLLTVAQENSTYQTEVVLIYQIQSPLDLVTIDQQRELHKLNRTGRGSFDQQYNARDYIILKLPNVCPLPPLPPKERFVTPRLLSRVYKWYSIMLHTRNYSTS